MAENNKTNAVVIADNNDFANWLIELKEKYLSQRLQAACKINISMLEFYWNLGQDIVVKNYANTYGSAFYKKLSQGLQHELPNVRGFSPTNLKYITYFYKLYSPILENRPQHADDFNPTSKSIENQKDTYYIQNRPHAADNFNKQILFSIPWDHHRRIIDKCKDDVNKAIFFVKKTLENNWSRDVLLNWLDTDLYERDGKAITNFRATLPSVQGDLAQQITKDPYHFDFLNLREKHDERELEDQLIKNVTRFLLELGKGFSYMGRQFRLSVGSQEFFPDLLFYNTNIHAYVVIELKAQTFQPSFLGQLSFYVSAINNQFKTEGDNPTIGLLICKEKDNVVAKYALDAYNQPIGISEYQLSQLFPKDFKSSLPTIEELESGLKN
ncbi:MAG: PDDEXK nuclease domain-containing protein [Prevotella sp.]|nr:PDDEXK nuclease domain-containing protein [Prevotella sp.]